MSENSIKWYNVIEKPFKLYGVRNDFTRLDLEFAQSVNENVAQYSVAAAGGRVRFSTNSKTVSIRAKIEDNKGIGFDLYSIENGVEIFKGGFRKPDCFIHDGDFESSVKGSDGTEMKNFTLNLPYVGLIKNLEIGLDDTAEVSEGTPYINEVPIVFYGSSITHGAWASRPGNTYEAQLSQRFNVHYLNLGFAGGARGEQTIAEYIAALDMFAFVLDYDHNAPGIEHLKKTHLKFFETIRKAHPNLPVLMLTKPDWFNDEVNDTKRAEIICETYETAKQNGDDNVWFIDGKTFFAGDFYHNCTKDGCHPNDLGFYRMARVIAPVLGKALGIKETVQHDLGPF